MNSALLFLLTRLVVHRKLVRDKPIQECIDLVNEGLVGEPEAWVAETHRICPLRAYLSPDPVNLKCVAEIGHPLVRTSGFIIYTHSESLLHDWTLRGEYYWPSTCLKGKIYYSPQLRHRLK